MSNPEVFICFAIDFRLVLLINFIDLALVMHETGVERGISDGTYQFADLEARCEILVFHGFP